MILRQYLQQGHCQAQPVKAKPLIFIRRCTSLVLLLPLADVVATSQESPSKFLITLKTRSTIASPHTSVAMTSSASDFTMELERNVT
jgi:ABC-type sulfate transport system permease component